MKADPLDMEAIMKFKTGNKRGWLIALALFVIIGLIFVGSSYFLKGGKRNVVQALIAKKQTALATASNVTPAALQPPVPYAGYSSGGGSEEDLKEDHEDAAQIDSKDKVNDDETTSGTYYQDDDDSADIGDNDE